MKFIKYPGQQIINLEKIVSITMSAHKKATIEFDIEDNCFYWNFATEEEAIKVLEKVISIIRSRDSLIEIPSVMEAV